MLFILQQSVVEIFSSIYTITVKCYIYETLFSAFEQFCLSRRPSGPVPKFTPTEILTQAVSRSDIFSQIKRPSNFCRNYLKFIALLMGSSLMQAFVKGGIFISVIRGLMPLFKVYWTRIPIGGFPVACRWKEGLHFNRVTCCNINYILICQALSSGKSPGEKRVTNA